MSTNLGILNYFNEVVFMLKVCSIQYAGEDYILHIATNGSRMRYTLFNVYTQDVKDEMMLIEDSESDEMAALKAKRLKPVAVNIDGIVKLKEFVVGSFQSDRKGNKVYIYGDLTLLSKVMRLYENINNQKYKESDAGVTVSDGYAGKRYSYEAKDTFVTFEEVLTFGDQISYKSQLSFRKEDLTLRTEFESEKKANAAPFKGWEWEEDVSFSYKGLRRKIISLQAKTMDQLREEKDLSWYFKKDGTIKKDYRVLHTMDEVRACVKEIEQMRKCVLLRNPKNALPVAIDCETTGLRFNSLPKYLDDGEKNPLKDEIGGMSLTWKDDQGIYIPFLHTKFQNVPREECLEFLKPYLQEWYLETHNGLFDGKVFLDNDIKLNIQDDSMIMLFNIDPTVAKGSKGLKENTMRRYGHETLDHDDVFPSKNDVTSYYDLTEDIVQCYACADSDYTHKLCKDCRRELPSVRAYRLDMRAMKYLIKVNYAGNRVDGTLLNSLSAVVDADIVTLEELMYKFVGQIGQITQATKIMEQQVRAGNMTVEEIPKLIDELKATDSFKNARYEFSPAKPEVLVDIIYNKLNYPVVRVNKNSGKPTADKYALKDLMKEEYTDEADIGSWLKSNVMSESLKYDSSLDYGDVILIKADEFNKKKYPFVMLLSKWKELIKLKTTFFAWFLNDAHDNMYYSDFSMTNAETSRIIGRMQTLKGAMKKLIVPYSDDWYLMGVDFSQIEARLMAFLAGKWDLVYRLCNPRADYHVESAAILTGKEPWQITKAERGELKSVNFAVPYGMLEFSLAENLYGRPVTADKVEKARVLLAKWKKSNWEIQALLDSHRKFAVTRHTVLFWDETTKKIEKKAMRFAVNKYGRRRYFERGKYEGDNLDFKTIASIDRMAGNFPIQSYAAEIFKTAFVNICRRLEKEGLEDKVIITALVHDEFLMNVHRSVDKYKLYEILWDEMVQAIYLPFRDKDGNWMKDENDDWVLDKEHPVKFFFAGISIGHEWHDIHGNDAHEAPTEYLMHMVEQIKSGEYQFKDYESGDVTEEAFNETREFMRDLLFKECLKLQPDLRPDNIKFYKIVPAFFDYFLKGKLKIYGVDPLRVPESKNDADDIRARLEALLMRLWNVDRITCYDDSDEVPRYVYMTDAMKPKEEVVDESSILDDFELDEFDMFGDLMDEDLDNFDDEDEDFNISVPVAIIKKNEDDFKVMSLRTDPSDKRDIWDLVDFGKKIETHKVEELRKLFIRSDTLYIDVSGDSVDSVKELISYLAEVNQPDGSYFVKLKLSGSIKDTQFRITNIDREKIYSIMKWSIMA